MPPAVLLLLTLGIVLADPAPPRKPCGIAPSLPALTREEEAKLDDVIDRFILADTGRLRGGEGREAVKQFDGLRAEAIPALIRGLNKAATINHSCPVLMISKKLTGLLMASEDPVLLEFARDEIGAGVGPSTHTRVLQDLRVRVMLRKNALAQRPVILPGGPAAMSTLDLVKAVGSVRGAQLRGVLGELGNREEKAALIGILNAIRSRDPDTQTAARSALDAQLGRLERSFLKEKLEDANAEIRRSAIRVGVDKDIELVPAILDRLTDRDPAVRAEARAALRKLGKGDDFGPMPGASPAEQREAQKRWKDWWAQRTAEKR